MAFFDGKLKQKEMKNIQTCRFGFPKYPLDKTTLVLAISKDTPDDIVKERKNDLRKIVKFLIRQSSDEESLQRLKEKTFYEFLHSVGMFKENNSFEEYDVSERQDAENRYLRALSASIQGTARVFLKRSVEDIFINGYNLKMMTLFESNH